MEGADKRLSERDGRHGVAPTLGRNGTAMPCPYISTMFFAALSLNLGGEIHTKSVLQVAGF